MTTNDPLAACLSKISNAERVSKPEVVIEGISKMKKNVLEILKREGYLENVEYVENTRGGKILITLSGSVNNCGAIKPRFKTKVEEIEKFEQRYLPAKNFGVLIISTSKGLLTHTEAKNNHTGGRLIAFCY
ncbi:MAG: 30S ribosomal protein S8 [Candidatus Woesearchaeota archaeon]